MKIVNLFAVAMIIPIVGCSTAASAGPTDGENNLNLVDKKYKLSIFTDNILDGKYGFHSVGDFKSVHEFSCEQRQYKVKISSLNNGKNFKSTVSGFEFDGGRLSSKKLKAVNKKLKNVDIVGPIALQCSSSGLEDNAVRLTLRGGFVEKGSYHYSFKNHWFIFNDDDFVLID